MPQLTVFAQAADLHLLLLRDAINFGASWGLPPDEIMDQYNDLQRLTEVYTNYCTSTYDQGLKNTLDQKRHVTITRLI
ncbi:insecticidal delta-endotoxin Cry8Ea1 family protein [Bacillus cereus]|uniref:insecticidal delta-endotoxin Cry8Ea1 family protein n=1 Tax=Bacillus cereus TaxID=1396 RepID=UPI001596B116|nr:insecticidal delta-endotoxin Cry8Ea1 family protein [Bacillus cereus]